MKIRSMHRAAITLGLGAVVLMGGAADRGATAEPPAKAAEKPVAVVGDHIIGWSELAPLMAEAAGGQVLEEYALSVVLKEECGKRSITIGAGEVGAERRLLGEMLAKAAHVPESESEGLIASVRRSRGLGEARFNALLERNAALRAMVRAGVGDAPISVTQEDVETAYELKYGARLKVRLILVRTQASAAQAEAGIAAGKTFAEVATEMSVDPSAVRGGLLDAMSLADASYPVAVRRVLQSLEVGKVSDPIAVNWGEGSGSGGEAGFAIVKIEEKVDTPAGSPSKDAAAKELEREVRTVRERAQMDKLARMLVKNAGISAMDPALNWSWEQRGGGK